MFVDVAVIVTILGPGNGNAYGHVYGYGDGNDYVNRNEIIAVQVRSSKWGVWNVFRHAVVPESDVAEDC